MQDITGSTVLHLACEYLTDFLMVSMIVDKGADINAVRNDDKLPLTIVLNRLVDDPDNEEMLDCKELLERKGALSDWRNYL
jgi:ankyrin repeat protein